MVSIKLPIFFKTDESHAAEISGKSYSLETHCAKRKIIFYNINAIATYTEEGSDKRYTSVFSNGDEFICPLPMKEVELIIFEANKNANL